MALKHLAQEDDIVAFRKMYTFSESAILRSQGQPWIPGSTMVGAKSKLAEGDSSFHKVRIPNLKTSEL